ncbi:MAG TPA: insulinase family protein [Opitutaceae bacterium]|nr:insulinase family protein [Opitutaceae bacterium]
MLRFGLIAASILAFAPLAAEAAEPAAISAARPSPWPEVASDLPNDPALRLGTLPNGLRYAILPNAEPKDHVSLRFLVAAGSLQEADDERGLAHFIEHMAFRGTRTFPDGAMTTAFQRLGLSFGPDNTAFTTLDHTIYHLELPDAAAATLREGLRAFREYADGITFEPKLIERERGVVLSEMATRDTPESRAADVNVAFLWPRARDVRRKTIGEAEAIRRFTQAQFFAFYNAWYRPERMAVIVVGTVDPAQVEKMITEQFATLVARAPARPEPPDLITREAAPPSVAVFSDPGVIGVSLALEHPRFEERPPDTHTRRVRGLHEALAFAMLHARLQRLAEKTDASFVAPQATLGGGPRQWQLATIALNGRISDWRGAAMALEQEHRRAFEFGFTARELTEARARFATAYEESVRVAATRPSSWLAQQIAGSLLYGAAFPTPAELQRDLAPDLAAATPADCLQAFRDVWSTRAPSVFVSANPAFSITREQIAATMNESRAAVVTAPAETVAPPFAYGDFGPPGRLVRENQIADLDLRLSEFANGVRLNFKATTFEADIVDIHVRVGDGKLSQLKSRPGLDLLADAALVTGGLGRHTTQELTEILSSHAISVGFHVEADACVFSARAAKRDLPLACQVIAAFLTDASFRPETMREVHARFNSMYASLAASPSGPISMQAFREIFSGDGRFGIPGYDELYARDIGEVTAWLDPQFKHGPIELSIVGDVAWEGAEAAVAATLGALPPREARATAAPAVPVVVAPVWPDYRIYGIPPALKQIAVSWFWPVPSVNDVHEDRRSHLLASILADRLRVRLREELGATYGPTAQFEHTNGFNDADCFAFTAELQPAHAKQAVQLLRREIAALHDKGPTEDEFNRAKQPFLREMTDSLRTNSYWGITVLSDAQQRPERIAAVRDRAADIAAITREEIAALARRQLDPARAFRFATAPVEAGTGTAPPPGSAATKTAAADFTPPVELSRTKALYPPALAAKKLSAEIHVDFFVETDGSVQVATAVEQTNELFTAAAIDCVKQWKFKPGLRAGVPVRCHMQTTFTFTAK